MKQINTKIKEKLDNRLCYFDNQLILIKNPFLSRIFNRLNNITLFNSLLNKERFILSSFFSELLSDYVFNQNEMINRFAQHIYTPLPDNYKNDFTYDGDKDNETN